MSSRINALNGRNALQCGLERYFSPEQIKKMAVVRIGFAGVGGLGSNAAILLARSGMRHCVLVDDDTVDCSNLNRQHFFPEHVGMSKVVAMAQQLSLLNPGIQCLYKECRINAENLDEILSLADLWVEALDTVAAKRFFVERCMVSGKFVVTASGIGGWGAPMSSRTLGNVVQIGDGHSDVCYVPPCAPRVMMAAAMQADAVLERVLGVCPFEQGTQCIV